MDRLSRKFCSYDCKKAHQSGQPNKSKGVPRPHTVRARIGNCLTCGKEYRATNDFGDKKQVYCCYGCYLKNRRVSIFEQSVGEALAEQGIELTPQVKIGRWHVDFVVTGTKVVIEADGSFWHSTEKVKERDARKNADLARRGYILFRVDELAFYKRRRATLRPIINYLAAVDAAGTAKTQ